MRFIRTYLEARRRARLQRFLLESMRSKTAARELFTNVLEAARRQWHEDTPPTVRDWLRESFEAASYDWAHHHGAPDYQHSLDARMVGQDLEHVVIPLRDAMKFNLLSLTQGARHSYSATDSIDSFELVSLGTSAELSKMVRLLKHDEVLHLVPEANAMAYKLNSDVASDEPGGSNPRWTLFSITVDFEEAATLNVHRETGVVDVTIPPSARRYRQLFVVACLSRRDLNRQPAWTEQFTRHAARRVEVTLGVAPSPQDLV